jgi:hypothetical protein
LYWLVWPTSERSANRKSTDFREQREVEGARLAMLGLTYSLPR